MRMNSSRSMAPKPRYVWIVTYMATSVMHVFGGKTNAINFIESRGYTIKRTNSWWIKPNVNPHDAINANDFYSLDKCEVL